MVSRCTSCLNLFHSLCTIASPAASASQYTLSSNPNNRTYPLQSGSITNIHTGPIHTSWLIWAASTHKRLAHFNHAAFYTTTLLVHPFRAVSALYWVFTNTLPQTPHGPLPVFFTLLWLCPLIITLVLFIFTFISVLCTPSLWPPYVIGGPLYFCPVVSFLLSIFLFFPRLISAAADWMSTILLHMAWP